MKEKTAKNNGIDGCSGSYSFIKLITGNLSFRRSLTPALKPEHDLAYPENTHMKA